MTTINIQTDDPLKNQVQAVFDDLGLDVSTVVNLFFRHLAYGEALPFETDRRAIQSPLEKEKSENSRKFKFGGWEGKIIMSDDFNAPMEEFEDYM